MKFVLIALISAAVTLSAAPIFDVTSLAGISGTFATGPAMGTSNGVAWTITTLNPAALTWMPNTTTDGTHSFSGANFVPELLNTDRLHLGNSFELEFSQSISNILF